MNTIGAFPDIRMRRRRSHAWLRDMVAETSLQPADLVLPLFVMEGEGKQEAIAAMPGVYRLSIDAIVTKAREAHQLGIPAIALFPVIDPSLKTHQGEASHDPDNLICRTIAAIKKTLPGLGIICDVALDPYTISGHDGVLMDGVIANDETVAVLCKQALTLAEAGCDIVAPSDMMDGRVLAIRRVLDSKQFLSVNILSYAVKYASCLYGPFRQAVGSAKNLGHADKKTYQMDYRNSREAILEAALDAQEGADMLMVKPATWYLDIIATVKPQLSIPVLAYQVSGEYAMIQAAAAQGYLDASAALYESLIACKRAGASAIFTYGACEVAASL